MNTTARTQAGTLGETLIDVRKELLDFGMRNPLLNYRPLKARGAEIFDADPS